MYIEGQEAVEQRVAIVTGKDSQQSASACTYTIHDISSV